MVQATAPHPHQQTHWPQQVMKRSGRGWEEDLPGSVRESGIGSRHTVYVYEISKEE